MTALRSVLLFGAGGTILLRMGFKLLGWDGFFLSLGFLFVMLSIVDDISINGSRRR